jgi:mono/diheme cytochrome c family protein
MPLSGPPFLDAAEITMVERWINAGLPAGSEIATRPAVTLPTPDEAIDYRHVEAILLRRCATCHSASGLMGAAPEGYLLSSYAATLASDERARVVPGNPAASELVRRTADESFFGPFQAWIGGSDAPVRARLAAAFIMGMEVSRELTGGQTLTREQSENMHARMAAILQDIIDG